MKRMIRLSALLLAGVLSMSALAGCSQPASNAAASETAAATEAPAATETPAATEAPAASEGNDTAAEDEGDAAAAGGNVLVVYFSGSGHTETVAQTIAETTGGNLFEITPAEPYTEADLNYGDENSRVSREHEDESLRNVALAVTTPDHWDSYDTVFVGYPIWWGIAAWPVSSFVEANDFTGKTVIPFCTSASSGLGQSGSLLAEAAGTGSWQEGERFSSSATSEDVAAWVDGLGLDG